MSLTASYYQGRQQAKCESAAKTDLIENQS